MSSPGLGEATRLPAKFWIQAGAIERPHRSSLLSLGHLVNRPRRSQRRAHQALATHLPKALPSRV